MRILALEPYYGGSHRAFLDGWMARSRHQWDLHSLSASRWNWRMHHAAITFARELDPHGPWDCLFCTSMLDLASFLGLAPPSVQCLPCICYFHENQLTYPESPMQRADDTFGFMNLKAGLAADAVWFNSQFHRASFLSGLGELMQRLPRPRLSFAIEDIRARSSILPQGIQPMPARPPRPSGPLHILWAARWEHDKNPEDLFAALGILLERNVDFRVSVVGQQFRVQPPVFDHWRPRLGDRVVRWGYQPDRGAFVDALLEADVMVSTAQHEFFGVGIMEGVAAGIYPLVPRRLSYPELLDAGAHPAFFYDGSPSSLADSLQALAGRVAGGAPMWETGSDARDLAAPYLWPELAPRLDDAVEHVLSGRLP